MSRKTDPAKRDAKFAFRKGRSETIANIRAEREAAFAKMFADVIDRTPTEDIERIATEMGVDPTEVKDKLRGIALEVK